MPASPRKSRRPPSSADSRRHSTPRRDQPDRQASAFRTARRQHATETAEDYVELIDELIRERGEARSVDMAQRLGVTHVTVAKTIHRLQADEGLIHYKPYRAIFLTPKGKDLARRCRERHDQVVAFLTALGVSDETAQIDAEGIEHHVSEETLEAMRRFVHSRRRGGASHRTK